MSQREKRRIEGECAPLSSYRRFPSVQIEFTGGGERKFSMINSRDFFQYSSLFFVIPSLSLSQLFHLFFSLFSPPPFFHPLHFSTVLKYESYLNASGNLLRGLSSPLFAFLSPYNRANTSRASFNVIICTQFLFFFYFFFFFSNSTRVPGNCAKRLRRVEMENTLLSRVQQSRGFRINSPNGC